MVMVGGARAWTMLNAEQNHTAVVSLINANHSPDVDSDCQWVGSWVLLLLGAAAGSHCTVRVSTYMFNFMNSSVILMCTVVSVKLTQNVTSGYM